MCEGRLRTERRGRDWEVGGNPQGGKRRGMEGRGEGGREEGEPRFTSIHLIRGS